MLAFSVRLSLRGTRQSGLQAAYQVAHPRRPWVPSPAQPRSRLSCLRRTTAAELSAGDLPQQWAIATKSYNLPVDRSIGCLLVLPDQACAA